MGSSSIDRDIVTGAQASPAALMELAKLFSAVEVRRRPKLVDAEGVEMEIPDDIFEALRKVVYILKKGQMVAVVSVHHQLTTQQAANILNVSRPHLIGLLDAGKIPYSKTGRHRRITYGDLMDYKKMRDQERRAELAALTNAAERAGEYT